MNPEILTCTISDKYFGFRGSKNQVNLLFLPTKIPPIYRGHIIFNDHPLN
jgi:hypothetical protein